jgi:hypothetical protein
MSNACAQNHLPVRDSRFPLGCRFLGQGYAAEKDDPAEEHRYADSSNKFYQLWCTSVLSSQPIRETAADEMAESWKKLWYRDDPWNVAFHEAGSIDLSALLATTHKLPRPLAADPEFMHDWLYDCSDRCFMIYGDDDPGARQEWKRLMQLRKDVMDHLGSDPAGRSVIKMLRNAKLYPVK